MENGDECGGEPATVRLLVWDGPGDQEPEVITTDIADHDPEDGSVWALVFAPEDAEIPLLTSAINLQDPTAAEEGRQPPTATSLPLEDLEEQDPSTPTTAPAEGEGSTSTTAATSIRPPTVPRKARDAMRTSVAAPVSSRVA